MVDPISVIPLVEGSVGLVLQCGSVAKTLSDMKAKFKHTEVAIMSLIQEVETIQFAWSRIKEWSEDHAEASRDSQLVQRLEKSLECGTLVLSALEKDLADYKHRPDNASFVLRSKMAWNERAFLDHQHRVRGQVQAMTLLLQVSQLSTSKAQTKLLRKKEKEFRASDESAYSIVPSRMSSHMSVSTRFRDSVSTTGSQELVYYPLSFEDELFTARVYKRNYRNSWIDYLVKLHRGKKREERTAPTANPEASEDGHSILSSSTGTITPKLMSVDVSQPLSSNRDIYLQDLRSVSPGPALSAGMKTGPTDLERSVQLTFFKDYYSEDRIHPNDKVATLWAYQPRAEDEFKLERGDILKVVGIWDDGWATGIRLNERAEDYDGKHKAQRDSGVSNRSGRDSPPPSGELKAFALVCVCLPEYWKQTIEEDALLDNEASSPPQGFGP